MAALAAEPGGLSRAHPLRDEAADIPQHGPRLHRGELILIPQQHQAGMGGQCRQQPRHQGQIHHGGFIHHQQIQMQRVSGMVPELIAPRYAAQEPVQGAGRGGYGLTSDLGQRQTGQGVAYAFAQAGRRLAGGSHQADERRPTLSQPLLHQQSQELGDGCGLAGAWAAGDDGEGAPRRRGHSQLLIVTAIALGHPRIQPLQLLRPAGGSQQRVDGRPIQPRCDHQIQILGQEALRGKVRRAALLEQYLGQLTIITGKQLGQRGLNIRLATLAGQLLQPGRHLLLIVMIAGEVQTPPPQPQGPMRLSLITGLPH